MCAVVMLETLGLALELLLVELLDEAAACDTKGSVEKGSLFMCTAELDTGTGLTRTTVSSSLNGDSRANCV